MKKLITILFGVMIMSFGLMSCMPTVDTSNEGENSEITNPNGNGESGNGGETTTDKIEGFTFSITGKNKYKTDTKILKSYDDSIKFDFVENSLVKIKKVESKKSIGKASLYLQYVANENTQKVIFNLENDKITLYENPNTNAITVNLDNNSKTVSVTIDYSKL